MNDYYGAPNDFRGYLEHHGIKGQKWGVKNGPPYPLDAGDHNARERKANWRSSLGSGDEVKKKKVTAKKAEIHKNKKAGGFFSDLKKRNEQYKQQQAERIKKEREKNATEVKKLDDLISDKDKKEKYVKEISDNITKELREWAREDGEPDDSWAKHFHDNAPDNMSEQIWDHVEKTFDINAIYDGGGESKYINLEDEIAKRVYSNFGIGDSTNKKSLAKNDSKKAGGMLDFLKKKDKEDKGSTSIDDLNKMLLNSNASALKEWQNKKAGGVLDFLKKKDKEDKGSASIDDLNKMLLNSNADAMKQWNNLRNQKVGDMESNQRVVNDTLLKYGIEMSMPVTMLGISYFSPLASSIIKKVVPNLVDNHITDRDFNEKFKDSDVKTVNDLPKTDGPANTKENARNNNPGYPSEGRTMNCVCCSAAMAMREKGYNVQARASEEPWDTERVMHKMFNNAKYYSNVNSSRVEDTIRRFGNGSYGSLTVYWPQGGGHNMFFKNEGDKITVYDSQSGKVYSVDDFKDLALPEMNIIRLDQATPNNSVTAFVEPRR